VEHNIGLEKIDMLKKQTFLRHGITSYRSIYNHSSFDLVVNSVNMARKVIASRTFIITEMALVRFDLIVNTVNVNLKHTA